MFSTGPHHSGENLRWLLDQRMADLSPPPRMCDGLSSNAPRDLATIMASCLSHGRRKFIELAESFPDEIRHVLESLREVYRTDAAARRFKLSPEQCLRLHLCRSKPVMNELGAGLAEQLALWKVEPSSSLGQATKYMRNQWEKLTLFLRVPGSTLDNNIAERALALTRREASLGLPSGPRVIARLE